MSAQVTRHTALALQVCVPADWTDDQAHSFAERECPCGTTMGWAMRKQGDEDLAGKDERVPCAERAGYVHIMFNA